MHYYAIINEEYVVMEVVSSATIIDDPFYIEITEEQYNDEGFIGYFYDQDKNEFVGFVTWMATSNEVRYDETYRTLTGKLNEMDEEIATHTHDGYVSSSDLQVLEDIVNTKADANHTHSNYAATNHTHDGYATQVALDELGEEIEGKANASHSHTEYALTSHEHTNYAEINHNHDSAYAPLSHSHTEYVTTTSFEALESEVDGKASSTHTHTASEIGAAVSEHNHDSDYADINHSHDSEYSALSHSHTNYVTTTDFDALEAEVEGKANVNHSHSNYSETTHNHDSEYSFVEHDHDEEYSPLGHSHNNYATVTSVNELTTTVSGKADTSHTHDDRYYTETEINTKLSTKSDSTHNHNTSYDVLGAANTALTSAKEYTDDAIADEVIARDSAIATAKSSAISTAASDATTKANNALASAKTYADSAVATAKNDLLNGAGTAYDTLKELGDLIDDNVDAIEALETVAAGKANASHAHTIANITNLQSTLDGKAAASHGTHVSYSTTAPVMDGSASVGTASTVARSDHKHPIDTSRAAQTSLDSHTGNKSNPHGVTLSQLGVTATASELNYVDGVTSNVQTQLDSKATSGHTHGAATTSASGFMTKDMVTKLNGIATGANAYSHPTYTARTGVPTANQTPAFGGTFTVSQPVSDGTGHITAVNSRTITIPSAVATASANGLMSKSDKSKLDGMVLATVSEVETYLAI